MTRKKPTTARTKAAGKPKPKGHRRRKPSLDDEVLAFIQSEELDRTAEYVRRGRSHAELSDRALIEAWKIAFRAMASDPDLVELRRIENDLNCEMVLRGIKNPMEDVGDAMKMLIAKIKEAEAELKADPDADGRMADLEKDFAEFRAKRDRGS
jgi:hypothetical protein